MPTTVSTPADIKKLQDQIDTLLKSDATLTTSVSSLLKKVTDLEAKLASGSTPTAPPVTPTTPPVTPPTTGTGSLSLSRIAWEGGPSYYSKFSGASEWNNQNFFPISVFLGKPSHADKLKAVGINTYMGAEHDGSTLKSITDKGMYVLAQGEWAKSEIPVGDKKIVGHLISDEPDMWPDTKEVNLANQKKAVDRVKAFADNRFTMTNFGNGVLGTWWAAGTMASLSSTVDVSCVDKYAYSSAHVQGIMKDSPRWPQGANPKTAAAYGWLSDQLRFYQESPGNRPVWVFVESGIPYLFGPNGEVEAGSMQLSPEQIEGAAWSAIVHEARGIAYFQHNNGPDGGNYSLVDHDAARLAKIAKINAKITSLAPVLNTQSYVWDTKSGADTMLKALDGFAYIFATSKLGAFSISSRTFNLPPEIKGTSVEVVGEGRNITVTSGKFSDSFAAEYTHHVYKVKI